MKNSDSATFKIQRQLYNGTDKTLCSITLEFSKGEKTLLNPTMKTIGHQLDIIPGFEVLVMNEQEIFAEKIRALVMRETARDLFDLVFLLDKGIVPELGLIKKKLELEGLRFDKNKITGSCRKLERIWEPELGSLVRNVPDFKECYGKIRNLF